RGAEKAVVKVWDVGTGKELTRCSVNAETGDLLILMNSLNLKKKVAFSPDGRRLAAPVLIYDKGGLETPPGEKQVPQPELVGHMRQTVTGGVRVWDADTGRELRLLKGLPATGIDTASSRDGKQLGAVDGDTGDVKFWDAASGKELGTVLRRSGRGNTGQPGALRGIKPLLLPGFSLALVYSPDGKLFTVVGFDSTLKVWDAATGRQRFDFKGHTSFVAGAAFSSDGKRLSSYGMDGTMRVWDLSTDEEPAVLKRPPDFDRRFRFSPDGRYLAEHLVNVPKEDPKSAAVEVRLWEAASGKELFRVKGLSFTAAQAVF